MRVRVLGCSGGVSAGLRTTSLLVDDDILIDAGSGVGELYLEDMSRVRHIFLTHSHMDHIAFLPLLVDSVFERIREQPITVHAQQETLDALKKHIFNWTIWPDFTELPSAEQPVLRFEVMQPGETLEVEGRQVEMIPVFHTVPAVGYRVDGGNGAFAFSGDTGGNDSFWEALNQHSALNLLIVECAFTNRQAELATISRHYCPASLAQDLGKMKHSPKIYLTHLKPGEEMVILSEVRSTMPHLNLKTLLGSEIFQL